MQCAPHYTGCTHTNKLWMSTSYISTCSLLIPSSPSCLYNYFLGFVSVCTGPVWLRSDIVIHFISCLCCTDCKAFWVFVRETLKKFPLLLWKNRSVGVSCNWGKSEQTLAYPPHHMLLFWASHTSLLVWHSPQNIVLLCVGMLSFIKTMFKPRLNSNLKHGIYLAHSH